MPGDGGTHKLMSVETNPGAKSEGRNHTRPCIALNLCLIQ